MCTCTESGEPPLTHARTCIPIDSLVNGNEIINKSSRAFNCFILLLVVEESEIRILSWYEVTRDDFNDVTVSWKSGRIEIEDEDKDDVDNRMMNRG